MSIRAFITRRVSTFVLSEPRLEKRRARLEATRARAGLPHRIELFHQVDDPYSYLLAEGLLQLHERFDVEIATWLVKPPDDWAAPERSRLRAYSLVDAGRLAEKAGIELSAVDYPSAVASRSALHELAATLPRADEPGGHTTLETAASVGRRMWGQTGSGGDNDGTRNKSQVEQALGAGTARRSSLGHYLGGTCWYAGEWTWGLDRLHYLEQRLSALGARRSDGSDLVNGPSFAPPELLAQPIDQQALANADLPDLHFFLSFRSPYTSIVVDRASALAEAFGVELQLRFVLPMVMRGLPVKSTKRQYILQDTAREARRLGVPFGPLADPVGKPVERGYSLIPWAIDRGRGAEYCRSFLRLVWSEGVDAGSNRGLKRIVEDAGLDWSEARPHLADDAWRSTAETNREELLDLGLWGVPSFKAGDVAVWGQDRLWVLEDHYRQLLGS